MTTTAVHAEALIMMVVPQLATKADLEELAAEY